MTGWLVAIDPGEHVGVSWWIDGECVSSVEHTPREVVAWLNVMIGSARRRGTDLVVVVEQFRLYATHAKTLIGSEFPTVQLIGVLKYLCERGGVPIEMQPASIKKPAEAFMRRQGLTYRAVQDRAGDHAKDAESHAVYYLNR